MAVHAYARDGSGTIELLDPDDDPDDPRGHFCIRAKGGYALVRVVAETNTLEVYRIRRNKPPHKKVTPLLEAVAPYRDPSDQD